MAAIGFRPVRYTNGTSWDGGTVRCSMLASVATNVFIGDSVILAGTSSTSPNDGAILNDVNLCTAGGRVYGVVVGVMSAIANATEPNRTTYGPLSTYRELLVCVADLNLVFESTLDTAVVVSGATAIQGTMYDVTATAGSTTTGVSAHVLAQASASTASAGWMVIGVRNDPSNLANLTGGTTSLPSTSATATILEVVCTEPQVGITQLGAGV
jgi:hypothetical protein